ncbi:sigma-70 family RNA polymerase sigma factor [Companilactobacillus versmoldensis]|uniref:RNA polymerase sigma factor n=1 Tax=Companilactobacillus versmoldensis DSM 14857 = KCTC 3814 TaxID=1423815 RepID=A0A0R1SDA2_9LACO|nr:sigma-70 family RNA polymerase sigma factor [Companilactobacillus versmoldensis]KRL67004.1 hypothetical protein FC27_GL002117 [Companilactobacillus versmoldensis DSM 14857 = KCTC 3814]
MELTTGFQAAIANEKLIHGVLKRLHIYHHGNDYQDYFQEGVIIYAQVYCDYFEQERDPDKFNVYIFQKLVWRLTDILRRQQRYFDVHSLEVFDFERVKRSDIVSDLGELDLDDLSDIEKEIFFDHFINEVPLNQLAEKYQCSTRNLRYHRNALKEKLCKRLS